MNIMKFITGNSRFIHLLSVPMNYTEICFLSFNSDNRNESTCLVSSNFPRVRNLTQNNIRFHCTTV